jgi:hypothetical protein
LDDSGRGPGGSVDSSAGGIDPALERLFRTLRQSLLEHLPGYKGPDVAARGKNVEGEAFYYVTELEQIIREWVGRVITTPPTPVWWNRWSGR